MRILIVLLASAALLSVACRAATPTATPSPTAAPSPAAIPSPTVAPLPTATLTPTPILLTPSPSLAASPTPGITPTPTVAPALAASALMDALRRMPPTFRDSGVWFGDAGRAARLAGFEKPLTVEEVQALSPDARARYMSFRSLPMQDSALSGAGQVAAFKEAYGFTSEDVTLVASTGPGSGYPLGTAYMEGAFQAEEIIGKLRMLGYQAEPAGGRTYYTIRDDRQIDMSTTVGRLVLGKLNRLYVGEGVLVRSPETTSMVGVLQAWAGESPSLADDPAFGRTAQALGDVLAAALLTRKAVLDASFVDPAPTLERQPGWGRLHPWDAVGFGQGVDGQQRWWAIALHYPEPLEETFGATGEPGIAEALDAEARELAARLQSFAVHTEWLARAGFPERPFAAWCESLDTGAVAGEGGATVTVRCALRPDAPVGAWVQMVNTRALAFLVP